MNRARVVPAALAAAATFGVGLPLHSLFAPALWMGPSTVGLLVVMGVGIGLRRVTRQPVLVALGQTVAGLWSLVLLQALDTTWYALPTRRTGQAVIEAFTATATSITTQAAPVRVTALVSFALAIVLVLLAVVVDLVAVTLRMPALSGLALLAAYVAAAANSGTGLAFTYFVVPAAAWIGLVGHDGVERFARWGSTIARPRGGEARDPSRNLLTWARSIGLVALVAGLALPGVIPHLPPTFIADGLGRAATGRGGGAGTTLNDMLAVQRSLGDRSTDPVLTYTTDDPAPPPLRVDVLSDYGDDVWQQSRAETYDTNGALVASPAGADIARREALSTFRDNTLRAPQLAMPGTPLRLDLPPDRWRVDANGIVRAVGGNGDYAVGYEEVTPAAQQLVDSDPRSSDDFANLAVTLPSDSERYLTTILDEVAPPSLPPAEAAWRIQSYLRGAQFTYALDLADPVDLDDRGRAVPDDALSQFLATRRGYCVQFSTAMTMMARARGIPARVAIGFLPGKPDGDTWRVVAADAHAWPELLFPGIGWVRFEPTPGGRSGAAPAWSSAQQPTAAPTASSVAPSVSASSEAGDNEPTTAPTTTTETGGPAAWLADLATWLSDNRRLVLAIIGALLALAATPIAGWARRHQRLRAARGEAERTEVVWDSMLDGLSDIGVVPGAGQTPRQARESLRHDAFLDEATGKDLDLVVATLERARYAPPGGEVEDVRAAADRVVRSAQSRRRLTDRVRARLWPREGRRAWGDLAGLLTRRRRSPSD